MTIRKRIATLAILAMVPLTSCRKTPQAIQTTASQLQPTVAHVEPERQLSPDERSCKEYVHKFYDSYVHSVWSGFCNHGQDAESCNKAAEFGSVEVISEKQALSPKLKKLFDDDRAAEAAANQDGVGYLEESDPYITGNGGPSAKYVIENVRVKDGECYADVYGESNAGVKEAKIMPELAKINGKWVFVNFHYHNDFYDSNAKKQVSYDDDLVTGLTADLKGNREVIKSAKK